MVIVLVAGAIGVGVAKAIAFFVSLNWDSPILQLLGAYLIVAVAAAIVRNAMDGGLARATAGDGASDTPNSSHPRETLTRLAVMAVAAGAISALSQPMVALGLHYLPSVGPQLVLVLLLAFWASWAYAVYRPISMVP